jgi:hypothetical protein
MTVVEQKEMLIMLTWSLHITYIFKLYHSSKVSTNIIFPSKTYKIYFKKWLVELIHGSILWTPFLQLFTRPKLAFILTSLDF